ncbi:MAG: PKD domain-containing protein, partial [Bacteroidetes bacterium]|nr:PKD domain-containing protein [Bacteroidota bacterium]
MKKNNSLFTSFIILLFAVMTSGITLSQDNTGKEFWFSPLSERYTNYVVDLYLISNYDCTVTIKYAARPSTNCTERTVTLVGGVPLSFQLPFAPNAGGNCGPRFTDMLETPETVQNNGIRVTSTAPIALYYSHFEPASAELTPILPITEMGKNYIVTAYREISSETLNFMARSTVTAMENNTVVTFTLPNNTWTSNFAPGLIKRTPGSTWQVTLNAGETYTVICNDNNRNINDTVAGTNYPISNNQGLNGLMINGDKNISVTGGSPATWIGLKEYPGCGAADVSGTHLKPTSKWSTRYVTTQTLQRSLQMSQLIDVTAPPIPNIFPYPATTPKTYNDLSVSDYLLITARDNGTIVTITGKANYSKTLNAGEWFIYESPGNSNPLTPPPGTSPGATHHVVVSNNPIQVVQMMKGWECDRNGPADPTQMLVREESSWVDNYLITNPTQFLNNFFVFVIKEPTNTNAARNTLNLSANGTPIPLAAGVSPTNDGGGGWSKMGNENYYYQRVNVPAGGSIRVRSIPATPGGQTYPFAFYASGSLQAASYGYMGGVTCKLDVFASADTINLCSTPTTVLKMDSTINGGPVASSINYNYRWFVFNGAVQIATNTGSGANPTYTFTPPAPGVYLGILEITDNAGCFARDSFNIVVNSSPPVATITYPKSNFCKSETNPTPTITGTTGGTFAGTTGLVINSTTGVINLATSTAGAYTVSYTYGVAPCTNIATFVVNVVANPTVTVNDPTICSGANATLTAVGSPTGGTFLWSPGGQTTNPITVTPASTSNYTVTYSLNGCTGSDIATVTVNPSPTVSVSSATICAGQSGTITATPNPTGGTYLWTPTGKTTASITESPASTTNYSVTYTLNGCSATGSGTITVEPVPTATISGGGTICSGQTATISIALTGSSPWSVTYSDGISPNTVSGITASPYTFSTATPGTYTLTDVSNAGCTGTTSGSAVVTVNSDVVLTNEQANCNPSLADYVVTFDISGGTAPYFVTGGTGTISGSTFTSDPIPSGTGYNFNVTDGSGCNTASASGLQDCSCPATARISGGGAICSGQSTTINVNFTGTAPFQFTYSDGTTTSALINTSANPYSFTVSTAGNYTLATFNDAGMCGGSRSGAAQVVVNNPPAFTVNNPTICNGSVAILTATPAVAGGTYLWTAPAAVSGLTTQSISVSPSTTTVYSVTYTLNGCSSNGTGTVTVNPIPTNNVPSQTICEGNSATIQSITSPTGGTYLWRPSGKTTQTIVETPATTTDYTSEYTLNGCMTSATGTITVAPTPTISVTASSMSICVGSSVDLTVNSTTTGGSYTWSPGAPNSANITVTPSSTTTYSVFQTIGTCTSNTASITITVNPAVSATASSNSPVCAGSPINLFVNSTAGAGYSWTGPNGYTSTDNNPIILNANNTHIGTYLVTVTANGCSASSSTNVNVTPTPTISVAGSPTTICNGQSTTLTVSSSNGGGTYAWSPNTSQTTRIVTVSPTTTTTYSVSQNLAGCVSNTATVTITVNPTPVASPTSNSPICAGQRLNLFGSGGSPSAIYSWSGPAGFTSSQQNPFIDPAQTNNAGTYNLVVTDNGCTSPATSTSVTVTAVLNTNINPAGPFCNDASNVNLTAGSNGGTWSGPGITNTTQGTFSPSTAGPGTHTITYSQGGNCPRSSTRDIVVNETPSLTVTATPLEACDPSSIDFETTVTPTPTSMSWNFGDGSGSTTIGNVSHLYSGAGLYDITVSATLNGCTKTLVLNDYITINVTPTALFDVSLSGASAQFMNTSSNALSYLWNFGDSTTSTAESP